MEEEAVIKYEFTYFVPGGMKKREIHEYDKKPTEKQLRNDWLEWTLNYASGGYERLR